MSSRDKFGSRSLDQEPDTIAIIPEDPDFVVIGTYSLVDENQDSGSSIRKGSLQIIPFSGHLRPQPHINISHDRLDFPFGIYDVHFHRLYPNLLGVATSDACILFYFLSRRYSDTNPSKKFTFIKLGQVLVEEPDVSNERLPIITQFQFIDVPSQNLEQNMMSLNSRDQREVLLAATTQFGNTKLLKLTVPYPRRISSGHLGTQHTLPEGAAKNVEAQILNIHKQAFELEAWAVLQLLYKRTTSQPDQELLLVSGGDDSQLIISHLHLSSPEPQHIEPDTVDAKLLLTLKKVHQAGVVSICNLGCVRPSQWEQPHAESNSFACQWFILTGSYDETLRLFVLDISHTGQDPTDSTPLIRSFMLQAELALGGGVWRIKLLDCYSTPTSLSSETTADTDTREKRATGTDYILLIAGHTSGAHVVRLTVTKPTTVHDERKYQFKIEKSFTEGHESLVYAVEAKYVGPLRGTDGSQIGKGTRWEIMSASFYDKMVCNWEWVDDGYNDHSKMEGVALSCQQTVVKERHEA